MQDMTCGMVLGDQGLITSCSRQRWRLMCLQVESAALPFSAEGQLFNGHFFVTDGILKVPDEVR